jgi:hypothetical protein
MNIYGAGLLALRPTPNLEDRSPEFMSSWGRVARLRYLGSATSRAHIYGPLKILRKIYGPKSEQGVWRIRSNLEIQNMYKSPDIVTEIKVRRLEWLEHVVRMEDTHPSKMVFNAKPEGRREVERPRLRWLDDVEADIKSLGVKRWRIKAQDRKQWSAILREAEAEIKWS